MRVLLLIITLSMLASCKCYENKSEAISKYLKIQLADNNPVSKEVMMRFSNESDFLRFSIRRLAFRFQNPEGKEFVRFLPVQVDLQPDESVAKKVSFEGARVFLGFYPLDDDIAIYCLSHQRENENAVTTASR